MKSPNKIKASKLKKKHLAWREDCFLKKEGFFPVFYDFKDYLPELSGGAVSLFVYIGINSNNKTGESYHSLEKIAEFFGKSSRTISTYFKELEEKGLIERFQLEVNGTAHTFIKPYKKIEGEEDIGDS